jgi:Icc protein
MFSFIQITDHHLPLSESTLVRGYSPAHALRTVLAHIAANHPGADFLVSTGDLVDQGLPAEYATLRAMLGLAGPSPAPGPQSSSLLGGTPCYFLPGNHDPRAEFFRAMFPAEPGPPTAMNNAFTHKGIRFIAIDWGEDAKAVATDAMLAHLSRELETDLPAVILSHHQVAPIGISRLDALLADALPRFESAIAGRHVLAILSGHVHATYEGRIAGIPVLGLRSTFLSFAQSGDEWLLVARPPHYRVVTIDGTTLTSEIVEVPL